MYSENKYVSICDSKVTWWDYWLVAGNISKSLCGMGEFFMSKVRDLLTE